jgi:hypothetical protein
MDCLQSTLCPANTKLRHHLLEYGKNLSLVRETPGVLRLLTGTRGDSDIPGSDRSLKSFDNVQVYHLES